MKENTEARKACTEVRLENSAEMMVNRLGKLTGTLENMKVMLANMTGTRGNRKVMWENKRAMLENTKESWASKTAKRDCKKEELENKMVKLENKTEVSENTMVELVNNLDLLASIQLMVNLESIQERSASRTGSLATGKASLALTQDLMANSLDSLPLGWEYKGY